MTASSARVGRVLAAAVGLSTVLPGVCAVGLVGSYARGAAGPESDVDLIVLTRDLSVVLGRTDWFAVFDPAAALIGTRDFGAIQERRLRLPDSLVVEVGVGDPSWADTDPIDAGTRRVVADGLLALHDPYGLLAALVTAVAKS